MIYNSRINEILKFIYKAHHGQYDKSGVPYVFHPFYVAEQMETEKEVITALLHDVLEDTDNSIEDIMRLGIEDEIIEAIKLLTHDKKIPYLEYVDNLKHNPLARKVKLGDLYHNSDVNRLEVDDEYTRKRREKYKKAIEILESAEKEGV